MSYAGTAPRMAGMLIGAAILAGCANEPLDFDFRRGDGSLNTADAARSATLSRPEPDQRGLITYPNYQVAVARRGDSVADVAGRIGFPAGELAAFNGIQPDTALNAGAILALPRQVGGAPAAASGRADITAIAGAAIDRAGASSAPRVQPGQEPVRHQVARGETAFSIARLYGVTPRSLAEWNGLGSDFAVREGQFLIVPLAQPGAAAPVVDDSAPGQGSATPTPPSAASALPRTVEAEVLPASPDLDSQRTEASAPEVREPVVSTPAPQPVAASGSGQLRAPVGGEVIRPFSSRNEGIDIAAPEGSPVAAAGAGTVAAITRDTDQVPILVIRHDGGLLTVYANIKDIAVKKGDRVAASQRVASVGGGDPSFVHFEVRRGFDAVDPAEFLR